jgi:hypothetical protein
MATLYMSLVGSLWVYGRVLDYVTVTVQHRGAMRLLQPSSTL